MQPTDDGVDAIEAALLDVGQDGLGTHDLHIAHVRSSDHDTHLTLRIRIGEDRKAFCRPKEEPLDRLRYRLQLLAAEAAAAATEQMCVDGRRARKARNRAKAKANLQADASASSVSVRFFTAQDHELVSPTLCLGNGLMQTTRMIINDEAYIVLHNQPLVLALRVLHPMFVHIPILPMAETECCTLDECQWHWYRINDDKSELLVSNTRIYRPLQTDLGHCFRIDCHAPSLHSCYARDSIVECITTPIVEGPNRSVFHARQQLGRVRANALDARAFRILSYNVLYSGYFTSPMSNPFTYTKPEALEESYRIQLVVQELEELQPDLICLQEMGSHLFHEYVAPIMKSMGFDGHHAAKTGTTHEGCAVLIRTDRFEIIEAHVLDLAHILHTTDDPNLLALFQAFPPLQSALPHLPSVAQLVVLRCTCTQRLMIPANTHLFYREDAHMLRLLQTTAIIQTIDATQTRLSKVTSEPIAVVFGGDLNAVSHTAPIVYLETGHIDSNHRDWRDAAAFEWHRLPDKHSHQYTAEAKAHVPIQPVTGALTHPLDLSSACGNPEFTNYAGSFVAALDYIFFSQPTLQVVQRFPCFTRAQVSTEVALPSTVFPSDHISLVVDIRIK